MLQGPWIRLLIIAVAVIPSVALGGPDWEERGDAGSSPWGNNRAQEPSGNGQLNVITGNLALGFGGGGDYEDMYLINIADPANFSISTASILTDFDTQIWLFHYFGDGLLGNDDVSETDTRSAIGNFSNDGTNIMITQPGLYFVAISGYNNDPRSLNGPMFDQATFTEISGPDGIGGGSDNKLDGWTQGDSAVGAYGIMLTGVTYPVPEPSTMGLLGFGLLAYSRRGRRTA